ncbi:MAG: RecA/RadA recombinase [Methanophagales archaeon]|nr:RecA/RadA recombinase [Methanophagales archaeon]
MRFPTKYTSGCRSIDDLLGGGFESGTITQLYGEAGSGKTNICIQTAVECAKSGKTVIFLDCEGFSPERFFQIASSRGDIEEIARRIIVFEAHNFEQQEKCIAEIERFIAEKGKKSRQRKKEQTMSGARRAGIRVRAGEKAMLPLSFLIPQQSSTAWSRMKSGACRCVVASQTRFCISWNLHEGMILR